MILNARKMNSECDVRHHLSIDKMWVTFTLNWQKVDTRERTGSFLFMATQKFPFPNNIQSAYNETKSFLYLSRFFIIISTKKLYSDT